VTLCDLFTQVDRERFLREDRDLSRRSMYPRLPAYENAVRVRVPVVADVRHPSARGLPFSGV